VNYLKDGPAPRASAGQILLVPETDDSGEEPRSAGTSTRPAPREPSAQTSPTQPGTAAAGCAPKTTSAKFKPRPTVYEWKLVGKKELEQYLQLYRLGDPKLQMYSAVLKPGPHQRGTSRAVS